MGEGSLPDEIDPALSCLSGGEVDGQWYTFTVQNSGQFSFSIVPNNLANDYDWAVFNLTNASCADIATNGALEVSCNFSGTPGVTGANGLGGVQNNPGISVQLGQTFVLYVSNWSQSPFGYTLNTQVAGSTASIFDSTAPSLSAPITTECTRMELGITFSELVLCTSVQALDFTLNGPGGPYAINNVTSAICAAGGDQSNTYQLTVSPPMIESGDYTLVLSGSVTDLCGNQSAIGSSIIIPMTAQLDLTAISEASSCGGEADGSIVGTATGGNGILTYRLNGTTPQVNNSTYVNLIGGIYTISVQDAANCQASYEVEVVQANSDMVSTVQATDISCNGVNDGMAVASTSGSVGSWSYTWIDANGAIVRTALGVASDTLINANGEYQVIITEGAFGTYCSDTLLTTIVEPSLLLLSTVPHDTTICLSGAAQLASTAQGGTGALELHWMSGLVGNGPHTVSPTTTTTYRVVAEDTNGCTTDTVAVLITVLDPIVFDTLMDFRQCRGVRFVLQANNVTGGDAAYTYAWSHGSSTSALLVDSLYDDTNVCITISDGCGTPPVTSCADVTVLQTPPLVLTVDTAFGCAPFQVRLALRDTTAGATILWNFGDGIGTSGVDSIDHIYSDAGLYSVTATATWPNGCITDTTITQMIRVIQVPVSDLAWTPEPLTIFEPVAHFHELATPNEISYAWDFFAFGTSDERDPTITFPNDEGRYYPVQLIVENVLGCADTLLRLVHVEDQFLVYIPNAFSPDGDGNNETFRVEGNDISAEEFQLRIFDRWGKEVFTSDDPAEPWYGTIGGNEGEPLPQGVYNYRSTIRSKQTLQKRIVLGHVTLLR